MTSPEREEGDSCCHSLYGSIMYCCRYDVSELTALVGTLTASGESRAPWRALLEATSESAAFEAHYPCAVCSRYVVAAEIQSDGTLQSHAGDHAAAHYFLQAYRLVDWSTKDAALDEAY